MIVHDATRRRPGAFRPAACVLLALAVATAGRLSAQTETETVDRTLTLQPGGALRLRTFSGRVEIRGGPGDQVVIKAVRRANRQQLNDITLDIVQTGNTIDVNANHRRVERDSDNVVSTDFDIQVPARTRLEIKTFSAPVTVVGVAGSQRFDGFSSDIRVDASEWTAGDGIEASTFSGDIDLRLPADARGTLEFNSFSGAFDSDWPVTLTASRRRNVRGALNGGGPGEFRLKTFSGSVSIRK
jgi:hypothetical protein